MSNFELPTDVRLTGGEVTKSLRRAPLKKGWYQFRVKFAEGTQETGSEKATLFNNLTFVPLDDAGNEAKRASIKHKLYLPYVTRSGHKPKTMSMCVQYLQAAMPAKFSKPRKTAAGYEYNGAGISADEASEIFKTVDAAVANELNQRTEDAQRYIGDEVFAEVQHKADENDPDNVYVQLNPFSFRATPPDSADVIYSDFTSSEE